MYGNRRRIRGEHGKGLLRRRGELLERSFAHAYETGGMRRVYLRGRDNVLKRVLIHVGALNLSLVMRQGLGKGTPARSARALGGESADVAAALDGGSGAPSGARRIPAPADAARVPKLSFPSRQSEQPTSATDC